MASVTEVLTQFLFISANGFHLSELHAQFIANFITLSIWFTRLTDVFTAQEKVDGPEHLVPESSLFARLKRIVFDW